MREIPLTQGKIAIVDDEDATWLTQWAWRYQARYGKQSHLPGFAVRWGGAQAGKRIAVLMHREITGAPPDMCVDHINGDPLDNRTCNLRTCTLAENSRNQRRALNNTSGFKGVHWEQDRGKWHSSIGFTQDGRLRHIFLGRFDNAEEAAIAYDRAALKYFGEYACLNFPHESRTVAELTSVV